MKSTTLILCVLFLIASSVVAGRSKKKGGFFSRRKSTKNAPSCKSGVEDIVGAIDRLKDHHTIADTTKSFNTILTTLHNVADCHHLTPAQINKMVEGVKEDNPCITKKVEEFLDEFSEGKASGLIKKAM